MRMAVAACAAGLLLTGCASSPPTPPMPLVSPIDGEFRGPVVSSRSVPISRRYTAYCESRPYRWTRGWYRVYGDCPPAQLRRTTVIIRK